MRNWTIIDTVYLYDGSMEGLFTIVYKCLKEKCLPQDIQVEELYVANLIDPFVFIQTNYDDSTLIFNEISSNISEFTLYHIYTAFLAGYKHKGYAIVQYLIYAFKYGKNINFMKSIDCVIEIQRICNSVKYEAHRFTGFIRFKALSNQFLYADYESDHDILEILAQHFVKRLKQEIWMIHDKTRNKIALYNRKNFIIVDAKTIDMSAIESDKEDDYLLLWKDYFKNISIKERENRRCQMHFMPKKYWKYLPEV